MPTQSDTDDGSFCFQLLRFQSAKNTTKAPHQRRKEQEEANAKKKNSFVKRHEKKVCI